MHDEGVAGDEMRWFRPHRDEIDAVLGDDLLNDDLADVAAIVHDLRSAYLRDEPMPRHPALLAFTAMPLDENGEPLVTAVSNAHGSAPQTAGLPNREPTRKRNRMLESVSALVATVAGKVVLGTAVAAASVGGLHAADVVDVPGLPDRAAEQAVTVTDEAGDQSQNAEGNGEPAEAAADGQETAEAAKAKQEAAADFTSAMEEWSTCAEEAEGDPVEECGPRPHPSDFGLTTPPTTQADGAPESSPAPGAATQGADNDPTDSGTNTPAPATGTEGSDNDPSDQGTTTPPDGIPSGAPSGTPSRP